MVDPREMQAGPELDAAIAEEVFGWKWFTNRHNRGLFWLFNPTQVDEKSAFFEIKEGDIAIKGKITDGVPAFSSDPSASAELRAKLWGMGFDVTVKVWKRSNSEWVVGRYTDQTTVTVETHPFAEISVSVDVPITGPDPRPAEFLAVARCGLIAARARKAGAP